MKAAGRSTLRRYPALGFLVVAALLASLLPSALRVPLSGPTASAELAPVPGRGEGVGDLSALGGSSGEGLGSGAGGGGSEGSVTTTTTATVPDPPDDPGNPGHPKGKDCVGGNNYARQTEDPLSPPCMRYFSGDNFGATAKGVTRDEVRIAVTGACDPNAYQMSEGHDPNDPDDIAGPDFIGYSRYFNERFQTYGRRVRVWYVKPQCASNDAVGARQVINQVQQKLDPFAIFSTFGRLSAAAAAEAARLGIVTHMAYPSRAFTREHAPYVMSFLPDLENQAELAASFLCERLAGLPARFAGDPSLRDRTRRFGLFYRATDSDPQGVGARFIVDGIKARCPAKAGEIVVGSVNGDPANHPQVAANLKLAGVTTVIHVEESSEPTGFVVVADGAKWYPEWFVAGGETGNTVARLYKPKAEWNSAFGITPHRRVGIPAERPHVVAAREGCDCTNYTGAYAAMYEVFLLMFTGIQAAGPRLTAANMDKGLHAIKPYRSGDPRAPAAYFAPGNHTFVKDVAAIRWDSAGTLQGNAGPGCYRLVEGGRRYRAEDWETSPGDALLDAPGQPCQGDGNG